MPAIGEPPARAWGPRRVACLLAAIGVVQFLLLTTLAMVGYAGGTIHDRTTHGYSLHGNYISDSGHTRARNGAPNAAGRWLFAVAIGALGLLATPYMQWIVARALAPGWQRRAVRAGLALSAIGTLITGAYPQDTHLAIHILGVLLVFLPLLLGLILILAERIATGRMRWWIWLGCGYGVAVLSLHAAFGSYRAVTGVDPWIQPTLQKLIVYPLLLVMLIHALSGLRRGASTATA